MHTYHMCNNYVTYIVTIQLLVDLMAALSTGVATMSNLAQLRIQDTEEQSSVDAMTQG